MEDITNIQDDNLGGIYQLRFSPIRFISDITRMTFVNGRTWINIEATRETGRLTEQADIGDAGTVITVGINCSIPKQRPDLQATITKYLGEICIIECLDNNGYWRRVGISAGQVRLLYQADSGQAVTDLNGYAFQFKGTQLNPAIFI